MLGLNVKRCYQDAGENQWNLCMERENRVDLWRCGGCVERMKWTGAHFVESSQTRKHVLKSRVADSEATNHNDVCFSQ